MDCCCRIIQRLLLLAINRTAIGLFGFSKSRIVSILTSYRTTSRIMASTHCICRHSYSAAVRRQALAGAIRHASSKPSPSTSDKNVANKQQSAFTDTILSSTVSSPADANSDTTSVAGTPASDSRVNSDAATGGRGKFPSQQNWLKGQEGQRFKRPIIGRTNWLGRTVNSIHPSFHRMTAHSTEKESKSANHVAFRLLQTAF